MTSRIAHVHNNSGGDVFSTQETTRGRERESSNNNNNIATIAGVGGGGIQSSRRSRSWSHVRWEEDDDDEPAHSTDKNQHMDSREGTRAASESTSSSSSNTIGTVSPWWRRGSKRISTFLFLSKPDMKNDNNTNNNNSIGDIVTQRSTSVERTRHHHMGTTTDLTTTGGDGANTGRHRHEGKSHKQQQQQHVNRYPSIQELGSRRATGASSGNMVSEWERPLSAPHPFSPSSSFSFYSTQNQKQQQQQSLHELPSGVDYNTTRFNAPILMSGVSPTAKRSATLVGVMDNNIGTTTAPPSTHKSDKDNNNNNINNRSPSISSTDSNSRSHAGSDCSWSNADGASSEVVAIGTTAAEVATSTTATDAEVPTRQIPRRLFFSSMNAPPSHERESTQTTRHTSRSQCEPVIHRINHTTRSALKNKNKTNNNNSSSSVVSSPQQQQQQQHDKLNNSIQLERLQLRLNRTHSLLQPLKEMDVDDSNTTATITISNNNNNEVEEVEAAMKLLHRDPIPFVHTNEESGNGLAVVDGKKSLVAVSGGLLVPSESHMNESKAIRATYDTILAQVTRGVVEQQVSHHLNVSSIAAQNCISSIVMDAIKQELLRIAKEDSKKGVRSLSSATPPIDSLGIRKHLRGGRPFVLKVTKEDESDLRSCKRIMACGESLSSSSAQRVAEDVLSEEEEAGNGLKNRVNMRNATSNSNNAFKLTYNQLASLKDKAWLNDQIINAYFELLCDAKWRRHRQDCVYAAESEKTRGTATGTRTGMSMMRGGKELESAAAIPLAISLGSHFYTKALSEVECEDTALNRNSSSTTTALRSSGSGRQRQRVVPLYSNTYENYPDDNSPPPMRFWEEEEGHDSRHARLAYLNQKTSGALRWLRRKTNLLRPYTVPTPNSPSFSSSPAAVNHTRTVLLPINHDQTHWALVVLDAVSQTFYYYDSLPGSTKRHGPRVLAVLAHTFCESRRLLLGKAEGEEKEKEEGRGQSNGKGEKQGMSVHCCSHCRCSNPAAFSEDTANETTTTSSISISPGLHCCIACRSERTAGMNAAQSMQPWKCFCQWRRVVATPFTSLNTRYEASNSMEMCGVDAFQHHGSSEFLSCLNANINNNNNNNNNSRMTHGFLNQVIHSTSFSPRSLPASSPPQSVSPFSSLPDPLPTLDNKDLEEHLHEQATQSSLLLSSSSLPTNTRNQSTLYGATKGYSGSHKREEKEDEEEEEEEEENMRAWARQFWRWRRKERNGARVLNRSKESSPRLLLQMRHQGYGHRERQQLHRRGAAAAALQNGNSVPSILDSSAASWSAVKHIQSESTPTSTTWGEKRARETDGEHSVAEDIIQNSGIQKGRKLGGHHRMRLNHGIDEREPEKEDFIEGFGRSSMQSNAYDCGVFVCQFAHCIVRECAMDFTQEDISILRRIMLQELLLGIVHDRE